MKKSTFDEMISHFNITVSEMQITQKQKMELLGMITAIAMKHNESVKHGHWYVYETGYEDTEAKCSICGFEMLVNEPGNGLHMVGDLKYCPHCGAKMDEVTE